MSIRRPRSLKEALKDQLTEEQLERLPRSFDVIGDIAIIETPDELKSKRRLIGKTLLNTFKNIKVVLGKSSNIETEYRTRKLKRLAGEKRTDTAHKEYGCTYKLDVKETYFSPRLGTERMRVASQVSDGERVLVMFAGVGPYAILIAKKKEPKEVVAVELNPSAVRYMRDNAKLNKVEVKMVEGDVREESPKLGKFDRVVMPLPKDAGDFLDVALPAMNPKGIIHFYDFAHDTKDTEEKVKKIAAGLGYPIEILNTVECGSYSPCLSRVCIDLRVG